MLVEASLMRKGGRGYKAFNISLFLLFVFSLDI